jgi:hypothetical protein
MIARIDGIRCPSPAESAVLTFVIEAGGAYNSAASR